MAEISTSSPTLILPSPDACTVQLRRIVASPDFDATAREGRFLEYVVEETIAGRAAHIKAYTIATDVFGRDASFDPQNDPIVRIAAGHLRRALERYYLTEGASDPIVIAIPKGGYVPTFSVNRPVNDPVAGTAPTGATAGTRPGRRLMGGWSGVAIAASVVALAMLAALLGWRSQMNGPPAGAAMPGHSRLLVERFENLGGTNASDDMATGLTQEVIGQLTRFKDITVVESFDPEQDQSGAAPRYALFGSVWTAPETFRLRVRLVSRDDQSVLWAKNYDGGMTVSEIVEAQTDIAEDVATTLAQVYGVILLADAKSRLANPPEDWDAYTCTLSFYAYRATVDPGAIAEVHDCLNRAVARFPEYATAWALLSLAELDLLRGQFPYDPVVFKLQIDRILTYARRAVAIDPRNIRALEAEMLALFFDGQFAAGRVVGERALALNPNDTGLLAEYGYRLALSGSWDDGCPMLRQATERNPGPIGYYDLSLALCAYFEGDLAEAVSKITRSTAKGHPLYHVVAAGIYGEAGDRAGAERSRLWLEENAPALAANLTAEVGMRLGRAEDVVRFLGSLEKAGLTIAPSGSGR